MMFFVLVGFRFSVPGRMVQAEARVRQEFALDTYEFWTAHDPYKPTAIRKQRPPDPANLLQEFYV